MDHPLFLKHVKLSYFTHVKIRLFLVEENSVQTLPEFASVNTKQ